MQVDGPSHPPRGTVRGGHASPPLADYVAGCRTPIGDRGAHGRLAASPDLRTRVPYGSIDVPGRRVRSAGVAAVKRLWRRRPEPEMIGVSPVGGNGCVAP